MEETRIKLEKKWITKAGLEARVMLVDIGPIGGHRNGYVRIPRTKAGFGCHYDTGDLQDITCHGGLTFSGRWHKGPKGWWIGYDCAHAGDGRIDPVLKNKDSLPMSDSLKALFAEDPVRSLEYCIEECELIAKQITEKRIGLWQWLTQLFSWPKEKKIRSSFFSHRSREKTKASKSESRKPGWMRRLSSTKMGNKSK